MTREIRAENSFKAKNKAGRKKGKAKQAFREEKTALVAGNKAAGADL